jgi:hypothetical protein
VPAAAVVLAFGLALTLALSAACVAPPRAGASDTPTWQLTKYVTRGWDRSFKCDLIEEAAKPPRVVVFGGSRSLRMDPATIKRRTGLPAFNAGFHNGRPEDAWAVVDFLLDRNPDAPPHVIWCLQATNFMDVPLAPGLIVDERLSQAFPEQLIAANWDRAMKEPLRNLLSCRRYGADGMLWWNTYDRRRAEGLTLDQAINNYLSAKMLAKAGNGKVPKDTRAMRYFERTLKRLNQQGVKPLLIIMPYHPRVLTAFLAVGWGVKQRWLVRYLDSLKGKYEFRVLNCLRIGTFDGDPKGFYDGSHLTASNSRRLIRYAVRKAPGCFRIWTEWLPAAEEPGEPVPPADPVEPPPYEAVPEATTPADRLE